MFLLYGTWVEFRVPSKSFLCSTVQCALAGLYSLLFVKVTLWNYKGNIFKEKILQVPMRSSYFILPCYGALFPLFYSYRCRGLCWKMLQYSTSLGTFQVSIRENVVFFCQRIRRLLRSMLSFPATQKPANRSPSSFTHPLLCYYYHYRAPNVVTVTDFCSKVSKRKHLIQSIV